MQSMFQIAALTILLLMIQEGFRCAGKAITWTIFVVLPLALTPYWIMCSEFEVFAWGKVCTILVTACWLTALRFTRLYHRQWAQTGMTVLFGLNILEAVAVDLANGHLASNLNATSGLLLVAMLPWSARAVTRNDSCDDYNYGGLSRMWIISFTLWNSTFLYINYPFILGHHVAVLGAPLIVGLHKPQSWLQARINLLALDLMALSTFGQSMLQLADTANWHVAHWEIVAAGSTLVVGIACVMSRVWPCDLR